MINDHEYMKLEFIYDTKVHDQLWWKARMKIMMNDHWSRKTAMNTCLTLLLIIVNNSMKKHEKDHSGKYLKSDPADHHHVICIWCEKNHTMKCLVHKWSVLINVPFMTPTLKPLPARILKLVINVHYSRRCQRERTRVDQKMANCDMIRQQVVIGIYGGREKWQESFSSWNLRITLNQDVSWKW